MSQSSYGTGSYGTGGATSLGNDRPTVSHETSSSDTSSASLGQLLGEVTKDLSTLMRQEVALAKAEVRQEATKAGKGAGELTGAALAGYFLLLFLSLAAMFALGAVMPLGWAALIVGVVWGIVAAVLGLRGKKDLQTVKGPQQTVETAKEIPPTLKPGR